MARMHVNILVSKVLVKALAVKEGLQLPPAVGAPQLVLGIVACVHICVVVAEVVVRARS
jgi:hypothetical protein